MVGSNELIDKHETPCYDEITVTQPPIQSLYHITHLRSLRSQPLLAPGEDSSVRKNDPNDLISRKVISTEDAEMLVGHYLQRTDHYLYGIASDHQGLTAIRHASPLLLTAILMVEALQTPNGQRWYQLCYSEFRKLIADFTFSHQVSLEDLRGLCIACFWVSDISWTISSLAIRRATELELHKSPLMALEPPKTGGSLAAEVQQTKRLTDSVRLWYLLYICDQHLAILYGRPSVMREDEGISKWPLYLAVHPDSAIDIRILSQIALLQILRSVSETFGQDPKRRVPTFLKPQLVTFNQKIDQWALEWLEKSQDHQVIGTYPSKAIMLHHHFSKLLISSHVFRGLGVDFNTDPFPPEFEDLASVAISSAKSVLELTANDADLIRAFVSIPHYYHTMIAFACSFLLKISKRYQSHIGLDVALVMDTVKPVIKLCLVTKCTSYHLVHWIGRGLQVLLATYMDFTREANQQMQINASDDANQTARDPFCMSGLPVGMDENAMQLNFNPSIWETASSIVYNDGLPMTLQCFSNATAPVTDSMPAHGESLQYGSDTFYGSSIDPYAPFPSVEHLGLGLL
ncbi:uncharacterized protein N7511_009780 [Penicillium nucicola]|uniref:uncharacterized protein n=1 Tax=Penicillium nucicola TaxID=1850975 RepID=UPI0025450E54|nr:uncharacterized protein N7511_009780 [Penicillium nucicola]KAJ5748084.1 hypothetical protein N7511_009780 [Penicillium nucicola]